MKVPKEIQGLTEEEQRKWVREQIAKTNRYYNKLINLSRRLNDIKDFKPKVDVSPVMDYVK